ncbi:MAG: alpha/beta fold hydrolase [Planctomycetota bacterium]
MNQIGSNQEAILLTHGFGANRTLMMPLARRLRREGYHVANWGYRSLWYGIEKHAEDLRSQLAALSSKFDTIHIVAHSMGNLVTRVALGESTYAGLRRIVMLCPPNHGSHAASRYGWLFGWLSSTLLEIRDRPDSFVNQLSENIDASIDVGVIQATTDFVVRRESTHLKSACDYVLLPGFHSSVLFRRDATRQVLHFLQHGQFAATASAQPGVEA